MTREALDKAGLDVVARARAEALPPTQRLAEALRAAAERIAGGAAYQWGHMGQCNCGHLAQVVTQRSAAEIHASAIARHTGEWSEYANDYFGVSGALIDDVFDDLLALGLTRDDLRHLEYLSAPDVVAAVGRPLQRNVREDAVAYFRAWADLVAG